MEEGKQAGQGPEPQQGIPINLGEGSKVETMTQQIKERKQLYQNVFESPDGKKILEDLERVAFIDKTTYNKDALRMAFNEGQRSIILHIKNTLKMNIKQMEDAIRKQMSLQEDDNV